MTEAHPVVVIGAGPSGLAAAAELVQRGVPVQVLERGATAGAAIAEWGHVRLFSSWRDLVAPAAEKLLAATGWRRPDDDGYPIGREWVDAYLAPLAAALGGRVRYGAEVTGVSRLGRDRVVDAARDEQPFTVRVRTERGEERLLARAVVDASGTWGSPNPLGGDGLPALGERDAAWADHVSYRVPDTADPAVRARYAGRRTAVVGSGHSALTALVSLSGLAADDPSTRVVWVLRRGEAGDAFGGGANDQLAARGALGTRARKAVEAGYVETVTGFRTAEIRAGGAGAVESAEGAESAVGAVGAVGAEDAESPKKAVAGESRKATAGRQGAGAAEGAADPTDVTGGTLVLVDGDGRALAPVDEVVVLTGFRPDLSFLSEIRLGLDATLQAPVALAPLIDPNVHSCGTVYPHGAAELAQPESGFYLAGMKSYGRAPTFLALTGYEQVRSIAAALDGDHESAARVELTLPETGVCKGSGLTDPDDAAEAADEGGCCGAPGPATVDLVSGSAATP
ncbi:NAD(P)-binding domain-containing protein [Nocardiopsis sp. NRRL B-16309]|uniref:NAD(P)-binding domain-containing protein n=1 Tax=Nocardiopsis sp. NRRL B-16309 TaxID=1519494 RepID=UPI0006AD90C6|nr:NAD(P)-binding domain-containing protein [Nocardiopsis sp. NRRL B-16309]KOX14070.1 flavoprotein [Nocardiopsis sp. NRRL B-16309]